MSSALLNDTSHKPSIEQPSYLAGLAFAQLR
jgi:hypothetical protein